MLNKNYLKKPMFDVFERTENAFSETAYVLKFLLKDWIFHEDCIEIER